MKAIVHSQYGAPELLQYVEVQKPAPGPDEVLVKVEASSVNFGDRAMVTGKPFLVRLMGYGLRKPKYPIPGGDMAGQVEAVGAGVTEFEPGDVVFADIGEDGLGAYAEYVAVPASKLSRMPANLTFEEAASVPQAAVVALQGLRDDGKLQAGEHVLVIGASGGIGPCVVQIARAMGAEVTGVCSTRNVKLVESIGADHVIDYTAEDFAAGQPRYDVIFDIVANRSMSDYLGILKPGGRYVACAFNARSLFFGRFMKREGKQVSSLVHKPKPADLDHVAGLIEAGKIKPVIARVFLLPETPAAINYLGEENPQGKVVITMREGGAGQHLAGMEAGLGQAQPA